MRLRCTNDVCRSCESFHVHYTSDDYELKDNELVKVKAGKRTKPLEESLKYKARCNVCHCEDTVEKMKQAYEDPMTFFDTENLCDCGGEIWLDFIVDTSANGNPLYTFEDGKAVVKTVQKRVCERCGKVFN